MENVLSEIKARSCKFKKEYVKEITQVLIREKKDEKSSLE